MYAADAVLRPGPPFAYTTYNAIRMNPEVKQKRIMVKLVQLEWDQGFTVVLGCPEQDVSRAEVALPPA